MKVCCVEGCNGPDNTQPVFFEFPTSRLLRKRWLEAINVSAKLCQEAVVCARHFSTQDYELVRGKTRLKSKVVPSLGSQHKTTEETKISQESTEISNTDKTQDDEAGEESKTNNGNNHNGDNDKVKTDVVTVEKDENTTKLDKNIENNEKFDKHTNQDVKNVQNNNENTQIVEKEDGINDNGITNNDNGKTNNNNGNPSSDSVEIATGNDEKDNRAESNNDNGKLDNEKVENDTEHNDNGKVHKKSKKTRCKITAMRAKHVNRRKESSDSSSQDSVSSSPPPQPEMETIKEDIEGILTNYYIENKKTERQVAAMTDVIQEDIERREEMERNEERERRGEEGRRAGEWCGSEPVFIELSVGQERNSNPLEAGDCLMLLESVQCDVDPAGLLAAAAAAADMDVEHPSIEEVDLLDDEEPSAVNKKEDPISLLTSSDEDDVIIQEPKIDTVEVSSADTSEDDMPLVKLLKPSKKDKLNRHAKSKRTKNLITKLLWGGNDFYCVHCRFTTASATEYTNHMNTHSKVLQLCQDCGFTTCSKAQMNRHKLKHKNERRFKCHRCNYSAKHKMSLVYHMKTHKNGNEVELAICDTFEPSEASKPSKASGVSKPSEASETSEKKHFCNMCAYSTKRRSDLKRHRLRIHKSDCGEDDDDEYIP